MDIRFETSNKFDPLMMENTADVTKCSSTNIASVNSKKSHPIKLISHFERKRPDICVTGNYIKNFTSVATPGNSNYTSISNNDPKILVVGDSHVKRIIRIDFNKELRHSKAYFRSFSGAVSNQLDHYIIPSLVNDKPVIIHFGTSNILYNASYEDIAQNIIKIGLNCKSHSVHDVFISLKFIQIDIQDRFIFIFIFVISGHCSLQPTIYQRFIKMSLSAL